MFKVTLKQAFGSGVWEKSSGGFISPEDFIGQTSEGTLVVHKPKFLQARGLLVACATKIKLFNDDVIDIIIVDDYFLSASEADKKVVLAHEQGHISNGDLDKITKTNTLKRVFQSCIGKVQDSETAADLYAANKVGFDETIHELEWLHRNLPSFISRKEVENRISFLKRMQLD